MIERRKLKAAIPPTTRAPRNPEGKVCLADQPSLWGTLVKQSEETSTVMWANGNVNIVENDWIKPYGQQV